MAPSYAAVYRKSPMGPISMLLKCHYLSGKHTQELKYAVTVLDITDTAASRRMLHKQPKRRSNQFIHAMDVRNILRKSAIANVSAEGSCNSKQTSY